MLRRSRSSATSNSRIPGQARWRGRTMTPRSGPCRSSRRAGSRPATPIPPGRKRSVKDMGLIITDLPGWPGSDSRVSSASPGARGGRNALLARGPEPPETPAGPLRYALICCGSRVTRWLGEDTPAARLPSPARPGWPAGARLQGARLDSSHVQRYPGPELAVLVPAQVAGLACTDGPGCPRHAGPGRLAVPPRRVRELPELGVYV